MTSKDNIENKLEQLGESITPDQDFVKKVMTKIESKPSLATQPASIQETWRIIMKSKMTKFATAAVIIVAIMIGINSFLGTGTSVAFADVIQPILDARTVIMDLLIGQEGRQVVIHDEVMGSRIRRTVSSMPGAEMIIDLEQMKMLTLSDKTAIYVELEGLGSMKNYLELLQDIVARMKNKAEYQVENQGLQKIEGKDYIVFVAENDKETITILVDPETVLPVRITQKTPNMQIVCDNLQFDVALDESRFSMEVPEGYVIQKSGIDFKKSSESGFIDSLRIWAEIIENGQFPDSINLEDIVKVGPKFDRGLKRENLTEQEQLEVATQFTQGIVFIRFFKGQGQWHYAGTGVELGDGNTPIFWYQPKDSETWRVIYGDLRVEDVAPEDLPK
jgi:hypothetical protein